MKKKLKDPTGLKQGILGNISGSVGPVIFDKNGNVRIRFKNVPVKRRK